MYKCPNCSGEMYFSPEKQKLVCKFCGSMFKADEFEQHTGVHAEEFEENAVSEQQEEEEKYYQATVFTCPQCGGELISTEETAATFCSFCGSSVLLESRVSRERKPDKIIPFRKSKEECRHCIRAKRRFPSASFRSGSFPVGTKRETVSAML